MEKAKKTDVYQMVTDRIIEQLENGVVAWRRPWKVKGLGCTDSIFMPMISHVSGKPYSMLNCMLLGREGEYLTFNQVKAEGGNIKKGAKSGFVVFYQPYRIKEVKNVENEDGSVEEVVIESNIPILKSYRVFHIDDCEGIQPKWTNVQEEIKGNNDNLKIDDAESVVNGYEERESSLKIYRDQPSANAYFRPSSDTIVVPMINQYEDANEYYSTLFHECIHSTGVKKRCDRGIESNGGFRSESYSKEELVAEIGSAMLVNIIGLDADKAFKNSVSYIDGWLGALKKDKKLVVNAASKAEKAAKYILNKI